MEPVRSHRSKLVVATARLHRARARRERNESLIEGPAVLADALRAGASVRTIFALEDDEAGRQLAEHNGIDLYPVDRRALSRLAGTETPRGPVAVVSIPAEPETIRGNVLVSVAVSDPGNVGALIRIAAAFNWAFAYTTGSADPWSPKTLRAGAGGQFQTRIHHLEDLSDLEGRTILATVVEGGVPPSQVKGERWALLIGEEAAGLSPKVIEAANQRVTIGMPGQTESLNAAVAAGIIVYELSKPRGQTGRRV